MKSMYFTNHPTKNKYWCHFIFLYTQQIINNGKIQNPEKKRIKIDSGKQCFGRMPDLRQIIVTD